MNIYLITNLNHALCTKNTIDTTPKFVKLKEAIFQSLSLEVTTINSLGPGNLLPFSSSETLDSR